MALDGSERIPLLNGGKFVAVRDVATAPAWWRIPLERAVAGVAGAPRGASVTLADLRTATGALAEARVPLIGTARPTVLLSEVRDFT